MSALLAAPVRLLSSDFQLMQEGRSVALLDLATIRSHGRFEVLGELFRIRALGLLGRAYVLERDGRPIARAERTRMVPPTFRIVADNRTLELRNRFPRRSFTLGHGDRPVGSIAPAKFFGRSARAELPEDLSLPVRVFVLSIVLLHWRRRARSS